MCLCGLLSERFLGRRFRGPGVGGLLIGPGLKVAGWMGVQWGFTFSPYLVPLLTSPPPEKFSEVFIDYL